MILFFGGKHEKYIGSIGNDSVRLCTPDAAAISGE